MTLKKIFKQYTFPFFFIAVGIISCDTDPTEPCDEFDQSIYQTPLSFEIITQSGTNLIGATNALYENDDVTVLDENGETADNLIVQNNGLVSFTFVKVADPIGAQSTRRYYLILPPTTAHPETDRDTIDLSYELFRSAQCQNLILQNFNVLYNDLPRNTDMFPSKLTFIK